MQMCVARDSDKTTNKCGEPCEPGFKYCEKHRNRTKAVEERENQALDNFASSINPLMPSKSEPDDPEIVTAEIVEDKKREVAKAQASSTIFDKVADIIEKTSKFADEAEARYTSLRPDELRYYDKNGTEQLRSEVAVYERALDRQIRALTQVAKLNIEAQAVNINGVIRELIQQTVMRVFVRMGLSAEQTKQARILLAEEFARLDEA